MTLLPIVALYLRHDLKDNQGKETYHYPFVFSHHRALNIHNTNNILGLYEHLTILILTCISVFKTLIRVSHN